MHWTVINTWYIKKVRVLYHHDWEVKWNDSQLNSMTFRTEKDKEVIASELCGVGTTMRNRMRRQAVGLWIMWGDRWPSSPLTHHPLPSPIAPCPHPSPLTHRPSPNAPHPSPLTHRPSPIAPHPTPLTHRPSPIAPHPFSDVAVPPDDGRVDPAVRFDSRSAQDGAPLDADAVLYRHAGADRHVWPDAAVLANRSARVLPTETRTLTESKKKAQSSLFRIWTRDKLWHWSETGIISGIYRGTGYTFIVLLW